MTLNMNQLGTLDHHYQDPETTPFGCMSMLMSSYTTNLSAHLKTSDMFIAASDEPAPAPEAPPPGEPLLNDFEFDTTNQFLDAFGNDDFLDDPKLVEFGAFQPDPPPKFHSVSSAFGPPILQSISPSAQNFDFSNFGSDLSARFGQTQLVSPTAMSHMTHSSHGSLDLSEFNRYPQDPPYSPFLPGTKRESRHNSDILDRPAYAARPNFSRAAYHRQSAPNVRRNSYRDAPYPPSRHESIRQDHRSRNSGINHDSAIEGANGLVFGSDSDFKNQSYIAPGSNLEDLKGAEMKLQSTLRMFAPDDTAPSSPVLKTKRRLSSNALDGFDHGSRTRRGSSGDHVPIHDKRQRKLKEEDGDEREEDEDSGDGIPRSSGPRRTSSKRSRIKGRPRTSSDAAGSQNGRRKSGAGEQKLPRQNLTEEEKKQNHIKSEQKRRNQIKDGFTNLVELMPGNAALAGNSKCAILSQAVDWMTGLIEGNKKLRAQLNSLM